MADEEEGTSPEEQALADEWAAALSEAGDASQDDIDAMMAQSAAAEPAAPRAMMQEFDGVPRSTGPVSLDGPT